MNITDELAPLGFVWDRKSEPALPKVLPPPPHKRPDHYNKAARSAYNAAYRARQRARWVAIGVVKGPVKGAHGEG